jgi:membrane fusion protein, adhesin transport system
VLDENRQPYFEVGLVAQAGQIRHQGKPLPVTPGMPIDASILTGERTVLQYLLKPVLRTLDAALQER